MWSLEPVIAQDFEAMLALRVAAMRESLERIGRFDPARAEARFRAGFEPEYMQHIVVGAGADAERVGFFTLVPQDEGRVLHLRHLYLRPGMQAQGLGSQVMDEIKARARRQACALTLGAIKHSDANRFYLRHGFRLVGESEFDLDYRWDFRDVADEGGAR